VTTALEELVKSGLLLSYEKGNEERGARSKLIDVEFILTPSHNFVREVKAANARRKMALATNGADVAESK
jgi:hypothetical protein